MSAPTLMLTGRAVELRVVSFGCLRRARRLVEATGDGEEASMLVASESAHWVDSGERVFRSVADIDAWPSDAANELMAMLGAAADLHRPKAAIAPSDDAQPGASPSPSTNGAAAGNGAAHEVHAAGEAHPSV